MTEQSRRNFLSSVAMGMGAARVGFPQVIPSPSGIPAESGDAASLARRREYLRILKELLGPSASKYRGRINVYDKSWEDWQERTGELPPDFETMPSIPKLPDPLVRKDGTRITTVAQWREQRRWIRSQLEYWMTGTMPPPPGNLRGEIQAERREGDATVRDILLRFGPEEKGELHIQVIIPPGKGPFPAFVTNHPRYRPWVNTAMRRGYLGCIYQAIDFSYGFNDDSDKWVELTRVQNRYVVDG